MNIEKEDVNVLKAAARRWDNARNTHFASKFFKENITFHVTYEEYEPWIQSQSSEEQESCYVYIGLHEQEIQFYLCLEPLWLIQETESSKIINCSIIKDHHARIPSEEAVKRIDRWKDNKEDWFNKMQKIGQVVEYFSIPLGDIKELFKGQKGEAYFCFGLTTFLKKETVEYVELIITDLTIDAQTYYDVTKPRPPF
ncbi:MAG: hypothetical protein MI974_10935 [Chitinophagales bacterium]|nr:hypothetical protein [Chitinophagales bacterium]